MLHTGDRGPVLVLKADAAAGSRLAARNHDRPEVAPHRRDRSSSVLRCLLDETLVEWLLAPTGIPAARAERPCRENNLAAALAHEGEKRSHTPASRTTAFAQAP